MLVNITNFCNNLLPIFQNLCSKCAQHTGHFYMDLDATSLLDNSINDRMVKLHSLID